MEHTCHSIDTFEKDCHCGATYTALLYCCGDIEPYECNTCYKQRIERERQEKLANYERREYQRRLDNAKIREANRVEIARSLERKRTIT